MHTWQWVTRGDVSLLARYMQHMVMGRGVTRGGLSLFVGGVEPKEPPLELYDDALYIIPRLHNYYHEYV